MKGKSGYAGHNKTLVNANQGANWVSGRMPVSVKGGGVLRTRWEGVGIV